MTDMTRLTDTEIAAMKEQLANTPRMSPFDWRHKWAFGSIEKLLLEREELLQQLETERLLVKGLEGNLKACEEYNEELLKDEERLDWLETQNGSVHLSHSFSKQMPQFVDIELLGKDSVTSATLRNAIDAAIAKEKKV